jgi:hypothetical protein
MRRSSFATSAFLAASSALRSSRVFACAVATVEELDALSADQPMTAEQAATLKRLAEAAYELKAFQPNVTRAEADLRIAMLTAKLKLLEGPPHTRLAIFYFELSSTLRALPCSLLSEQSVPA